MVFPQATSFSLHRFSRRSAGLRLLQFLITGWLCLWLVIPQRAWACACSEVVVGPNATTSNLKVLPESGELRSSQMDIDLPGFAGVKLTREFSSISASFGMFGHGWRCNLIANLVDTSGDISINFGDHAEVFLQSDGYSNRKRTIKLFFPDLNTIIAEDSFHNRWTFDVPTKVCLRYEDANGRVTTYNTTVQDKLIGVIGGSNAFERVYLLNKVTFADGRIINFDYNSGRCSKATSPSGFTVNYSYTDGLLTGITKSNGQTLSYDYFTTNNGTRQKPVTIPIPM